MKQSFRIDGVCQRSRRDSGRVAGGVATLAVGISRSLEELGSEAQGWWPLDDMYDF